MIGENIQYLRKMRSITQETLAELLGVARQTVAKWECGESAPDLKLSGKLSQVLDVSLDDLVNTPLYKAPPEAPPAKNKHMFGVVTVGDKGQIVIPVQARRVFHIQSGDQLMVLGDEERGLALVDAKFFLQVAEVIRNGGK